MLIDSDDKVYYMRTVPKDLHAHQIIEFPFDVIVDISIIITATKTQQVPEFLQGVVQIPRIPSKRNCAGCLLLSERAGRTASGSSFSALRARIKHATGCRDFTLLSQRVSKSHKANQWQNLGSRISNRLLTPCLIHSSSSRDVAVKLCAGSQRDQHICKTEPSPWIRTARPRAGMRPSALLYPACWGWLIQVKEKPGESSACGPILAPHRDL